MLRRASSMITTDFLVIGGGIIGISAARAIRRRFGAVRVLLIEKEPSAGAHASGRNSGVLHAGFYYSPDSLKARFTRDGNAQLTAWCLEKGLQIRRCGKLVVARSDEEVPRLEELHRRGRANGVSIEIVDAAAAREIEPRARVHERAIWSPTTSTVDPQAVMNALLADARAEGITVHLATPYRSARGNVVRAGGEEIEAGFVVNAAGLYADVIARDFGFSRDYRILPFKGAYLYSSEPPGEMRTHIYPVPDPRFPFLGVHFTVAVDGSIKIGPTAAPAFWREQYGMLENFRPGELLDVALRGAVLVATNPPIRRHAVEEIRKSSKKYIVALAASLATGVEPAQYRHWGRPGIRAQLYDTRKHQLEMDFVVEGDERSLHILNAVSPGFTCAMPFAEWVVGRVGGSTINPQSASASVPA